METKTKSGYKMTEVGLIPEDWEVNKLSELAYITKLAGFEYSLYFNSYNDGGDIIVVRGTNITHNKMDLTDIKTIPVETSNKLIRSKLFKNDLVFAYVGTIGPVYLIQEDNRYHLGPNTSKISVKENLNSKFLFHYFTSSILKNEIVEHTSVGAQPSLSMSKIRAFKIILPPLTEQTAIANALKDTDDLINSLESLIAKKKLIKQGAMQELLKPKEGWVKKKLGEVGYTFGGLSGKNKNDFQNGGSPYIPFMNIMANPIIDVSYLDFVNLKPMEKQNKCQKGDLFFNGSSETPEEVGMCSILLENIPNLYLNSFCFGFRLYENNIVDGKFLTFLFRSSYGRALVFSSAQGATRYNLSKANFLQLEIDLPNIDIQREISQFIFLIDCEIDSLMKRLSKYKTIKHGMMQQLLTGKIRLVD